MVRKNDHKLRKKRRIGEERRGEEIHKIVVVVIMNELEKKNKEKKPYNTTQNILKCQKYLAFLFFSYT